MKMAEEYGFQPGEVESSVGVGRRAPATAVDDEDASVHHERGRDSRAAGHGHGRARRSEQHQFGRAVHFFSPRIPPAVLPSPGISLAMRYARSGFTGLVGAAAG